MWKKGFGIMLAEDRRSYILKLLETRSSVTVTELSTAFGLSEVSVRKLLSKPSIFSNQMNDADILINSSSIKHRKCVISTRQCRQV